MPFTRMHPKKKGSLFWPWFYDELQLKTNNNFYLLSFGYIIVWVAVWIMLGIFCLIFLKMYKYVDVVGVYKIMNFTWNGNFTWFCCPFKIGTKCSTTHFSSSLLLNKCNLNIFLSINPLLFDYDSLYTALFQLSKL